MVTAVTSTVIKFEGHQNDRDLEAAFSECVGQLRLRNEQFDGCLH